MGYDWKITLKKFSWAAAEILVAGFIAYATERPEFLALVPFSEAVRNYLKNRNKKE